MSSKHSSALRYLSGVSPTNSRLDRHESRSRFLISSTLSSFFFEKIFLTLSASPIVIPHMR